MDDRKLAVVGVHAMLVPDDASAAFVNSSGALVPWSGDDKVLMDRFDARHLLENLSSLKHRDTLCDTPDVCEDELNRERYRDLHESSSTHDSHEIIPEKKPSTGYNTVPFKYAVEETKPASPEIKKGRKPVSEIGEPFVPKFPVPEHVQSHMPATQKLHQIISGTAKFVTRHGGQSEIVLRVKQADNPTFGFLMPDHHLHPYFRYLVEHPELTGALEKPSSVSILGPTEGLTLLCQAYGDDDDDDEDAAGASNATTGSKSTPPKLRDPPAMAPYKEPPLQLKNVINKMVEFISRNGKEFENVVKTRDKAEGKFDFLHPWHEYYPYYLRMLQVAKQEIGAPSPVTRVPATRTSRSRSARGSRFDITPNMLQPASSDEDSERVEIITSEEPSSHIDNDSEQGGMSFDEAFAAVMAATRGMRKTSSGPDQIMTEKPKKVSGYNRRDSYREAGSRHEHRRRRDDKGRDHGFKYEDEKDHKRRRTADDRPRHRHHRSRNESDDDKETKNCDVPDDIRAKVRTMLAHL